ncbi:T9SS type A sorting domain-containing protein [Flavobacterium sp. NRK F7]|uniref:T9SS type A sorting domain-containing protein n=1 Tax=Flavobacterium sp. NRK F7 TaxID=2954930 RepID=UPI002090782F|nr:T9SS type A sorting domain-containing protein [Flavobacterium sp. NRK F7]MCO6161468.1 T9SS type A sorting domain-containing protein [Flavobacterium sp. NRK F7]
MKKITLSFIFLFLTSVNLYSQTWESIGSAFTGNYFEGKVALNSDGNDVYFIQKYDDGVYFHGKVKKYANNSWADFGTDFYTPYNYSVFFDLNLKISSVNEAYISYSTLNGTTVKKNNAGNWSTLGNATFSDVNGSIQSVLKTNNQGIPYFAFTENTGNRLSVMKLNGGNNTWEYVGNPSFSTCSGLSTMSFEIAPDNTPYVVYEDCVLVNGSYVYRIVAKKFNGSSWVTVGSGVVSDGSSSVASLAIGTDNVPYVVYGDSNQGYKLTVKKFDGANWVVVGSAGFTPSTANKLVLKLDSANNPVVGFKDNANSGKVSVMRYNGSIWNSVGTLGFSTSTITELSMDIKSDKIVVCYKDNSGYNIKKLSTTLSKTLFDLNNQISVYPNPVNDVLNVAVSNNQEIAKIEILALDGRTVQEVATGAFVNLEHILSGIYLVKITSKEGKTGVQRIIKK